MAGSLEDRVAAIEERLGMEAGLRASVDHDLAGLVQRVGAMRHLVQALSITQSEHTEMLAGLRGTLGEHTGQLTGLQQSVTGLQRSVTGLEESVGGLQTTVGGLQTTVGRLETTVGGLETTVGELQTTVGKLHDTVGGHTVLLETIAGTLQRLEARPG